MSKLFVKWFGGMRPRMGDQHLTQRRLSETGYFRGPTVNKDAEVNVGNHATDATNCHLFSGELRPLKAPALAHTFCRPGDPCWRQPLPDDPSVPPVEPPEPPNCVPMVIESQSPEYNVCLEYACDAFEKAAAPDVFDHYWPLDDPTYQSTVPSIFRRTAGTTYDLYPSPDPNGATWANTPTANAWDSTTVTDNYAPCGDSHIFYNVPGGAPTNFTWRLNPNPQIITTLNAPANPPEIDMGLVICDPPTTSWLQFGYINTATRSRLDGYLWFVSQQRQNARLQYSGGNLVVEIVDSGLGTLASLSVPMPALTTTTAFVGVRFKWVNFTYTPVTASRSRADGHWTYELQINDQHTSGTIDITNLFLIDTAIIGDPGTGWWFDGTSFHTIFYRAGAVKLLGLTWNENRSNDWLAAAYDAYTRNFTTYVDPDPNCAAVASHYLGDLPVGTVVPLSVTVNADATAPVTYQWYRNGVFIPNEVGPVYTLTVTAADSYATYFVLVQNPCGQGVSEEWSLGYTGYICLEYSCSAFIDAAIGVAPNVWPMDDPDRYPVGPQDRFYKDPRSTGSDDMLILPDPSGAIWDNVLHAGRFTVAGAFTDNYAPCQIYGIEYDVPGGAATTYTWRQTPAPNVGPQGPNINMAMVISDIPSNWIGSIGLHQTEFTYYDRWTGSTSTPDITMQAGFSDIGTQRRLFLSTPAVGDFAWLDVDESELFGGKATFLGIYLKFNRWEQNRIVSGTRYYVDFFFDYYLQINNHIVQGTYQWESNYTIYLEDLDTRYWTGTGGTNYYTSVYRAGGFRCVGLATNTYDAGPEWLSTVYEGYQRNFTTYVDPLCQ